MKSIIKLIYPTELELKETTESTTVVAYLDRLANICGVLPFTLFDKDAGVTCCWFCRLQPSKC